MSKDRRQSSYRVRVEAAEMAKARVHPEHKANGDEQCYADVCYPLSFTKGLKHDHDTGLLKTAGDFEAFRTAIDAGHIDRFTTTVPVPTDPDKTRRKWEAPTAGIVYDLEGPDAQAVTMPPAPPFPSSELCYEMAEVYELALLRDVPFTEFEGNAPSGALAAAITDLNALDYAKEGYPGRPRLTDGEGKITAQTAFRGSSPGVAEGPYLSQFMLIGTTARDSSADVKDGLIEYGSIAINQRGATACPGLDYMQTKKKWLDVQDGFEAQPDAFTGERRFICTPRDLATYVHFDALYEAYLNACLILLDMEAPLDPGFDKFAGGDLYHLGAGRVPRTTTGFALFGGPHILTLVTEVATRALKAVRYQKFNNHIRLRPEALAGRLACKDKIADRFPCFGKELKDFAKKMGPTLTKIDAFNPADPALPDGNVLLPMAFPEGSPMHPAYGAGHATVAGACVTILKAFFDTSAVFVRPEHPDEDQAGVFLNPVFMTTRDSESPRHKPVEFVPPVHEAGEGKAGPEDAGYCTGELVERECECPLTLEGELNKLAANISIGRNMAGVHYFSDYFDSLRMGEDIAIGMLQEQALCYPAEEFVMSVPTFDGDTVRIGAK